LADEKNDSREEKKGGTRDIHGRLKSTMKGWPPLLTASIRRRRYASLVDKQKIADLPNVIIKAILGSNGSGSQELGFFWWQKKFS